MNNDPFVEIIINFTLVNLDVIYLGLDIITDQGFFISSYNVLFL